MTAGPVNRALLESNFQSPGDVYDDSKTEGAFDVVADQIDDNWTYLASLVADGSLTPYSFGIFRQALINGNMDIWQRGTSFPVTGSLRYTADRWAIYRDTFALGATVTRQNTSDPGSRYLLRVQRDSGSTLTETINLTQSIESIDAIKYRGQFLTLRFQARRGANYSAASNLIQYTVLSGTGTDENPSNTLTGSVTVMNGTATLGISFADITAVSTVMVPTNCNQLVIKIRHVPVGTAGTADYFDIRQVQLSAGNIVIPFQFKSTREELADCQRYYEKSYSQSIAPGTNSTAGQLYSATNDNTNAGILDYSVVFATPKRTTPTVTVYGTAGTTNALNDGTADRAISGGSGIVFSGETGFSINATVTGPTSSTRRFHFTAEAEIGV